MLPIFWVMIGIAAVIVACCLWCCFRICYGLRVPTYRQGHGRSTENDRWYAEGIRESTAHVERHDHVEAGGVS